MDMKTKKQKRKRRCLRARFVRKKSGSTEEVSWVLQSKCLNREEQAPHMRGTVVESKMCVTSVTVL